MALPTTTAQVEMMLVSWERDRDRIIEVMWQTFWPPLFDIFRRRCFPQRPHTDDTRTAAAHIAFVLEVDDPSLLGKVNGFKFFAERHGDIVREPVPAAVGGGTRVG